MLCSGIIPDGIGLAKFPKAGDVTARGSDFRDRGLRGRGIPKNFHGKIFSL
jgi:hypothetical protein